MGIMNDFFRSPSVPASDDGLVEPGDYDGMRVGGARAPIEAARLHHFAYENAFNSGDNADFYDMHGIDSDPMSIGRDMGPEEYVDEAMHLVEEFSPGPDAQPTLRSYVIQLREELRTRPWFRILCDAKLMVDESRSAWADRRHRALLAIGFRKAQTHQSCPHCLRQNSADGRPRHGRHMNSGFAAMGDDNNDDMGDFAAPGRGDFASPSMGCYAAPDNGSSEIASAIQSMGYQVANVSYSMSRAVSAMERTAAAVARGQQHTFVPPVQYIHQAPQPVHPAPHTSGVAQHAPSTPFPVFQQPSAVGVSPHLGSFETGDGMADFVSDETATLDAGQGLPSGDGGSVVLIGGGAISGEAAPDASPASLSAVLAAGNTGVPEPISVNDVLTPLVVSEASPSVDTDALRVEIAGTIKRLEQALEALKRPS